MIFSSLLLAAAAVESPALPAFMSGCWDFIDGEHWTQECWMEPKAGLMLGASREGTGAKLKSWEHLRIEQSANGKITLFASPGGIAPLPFEGRILSANAIEFLNAGHDYPQRIRYWREGKDLMAETSLADGSKVQRWRYAPTGN